MTGCENIEAVMEATDRGTKRSRAELAVDGSTVAIKGITGMR